MNSTDIEQAQKIFRLTSYLLQYPDAGWKETLETHRRHVASIGDEKIAGHMRRFLNHIEQMGFDTLHETYVQTFDFGRKTNLYVTYARHGEQRERGPALLALKQQYAQAGFDMIADELSDYLPLMLEFASVAPFTTVKELFREHRSAIADIRAHLAAMDSPYRDVFDILHLTLDTFNIGIGEEGEAVE